MKKIILTLAAVFAVAFTSCVSSEKIQMEQEREDWSTDYTYVFVHGLSGWGHYDFQNKFFPYWGMKSGSLMKYLRKQGFDVHDASVAPQGSAWDRACELYAQLTGTVTDYGIEHSTRCNHPRYGRDFSKDPLIKEWDSKNKINILGHSFGGVTVRLLAHLMANGSPSEIESTPAEELSPLFMGGHGDWIYSVTTLSAPHNGTSAYHVKDPEPQEKSGMEKAMSRVNSRTVDDRAWFDHASYDMNIRNAMEINEWLKTVEGIYYFSYATNATILQEDGNYVPDTTKMEKLYQRTSRTMGSFEGTTDDGVVLTAEWKMNDGLVNTCSALSPSSAPSKEYEEGNVEEGIWNVMPVYDGDHMALQGGLTIKNKDLRRFYMEHLKMINRL